MGGLGFVVHVVGCVSVVYFVARVREGGFDELHGGACAGCGERREGMGLVCDLLVLVVWG